MQEDELAAYATIVIGGSVRMGVVQCAAFVIRHWHILRGKHVIIFSVSATFPAQPAIPNWYERSFPDHIRSAVHFFPLPGRLMHFDVRDRMILWFPRAILRRAMRRNPSDVLAQQYRQITGPYDHVRREALGPLLQFLGTESETGG